MFIRLISRIWLLALCGVALLALAAPPAPQYKVVKHIALGGDGGWDYLTVDSAARRVYVSRGTRMMVVDADSGTLAAEITDTPGVHGIALAPELNKGFISAGRANNVVVVDLKTLKATGTVAAGENPDAILYEPGTKRVFAFNGRSKNVTVIDAASLKVLATIPVSGKPEFAAYDGHKHVFVNIEDKGTVAVIDAKAMKVTSEWPLAPCEAPTGLAIDRKKGRLFAGCSGNKVMAVVDAKNGKLLASVPIGAGCDGTEFDPAAGLAFAANGRDGTVTVVGETAPGKFEAVETVATQVSGRTIALDEKTHQLFIPAAKMQPPAAPGQRPTMAPGSFELVVVGK
ncbi:MAG: YncE family protein [Terriglobales bacterium]|jgi:YVTN family beta-propeller protein